MTYYFIMQSASVCFFVIESESCSLLSNSLPASWTVACQTPLSLELFRQEYCSGELFPSTGDLSSPGVNCSLPDSSVHGILQARILEWVAYPFSRGSSQPRNRTGVFRNWQADSLPSEPPGRKLTIHISLLKALRNPEQKELVSL